MDYDKFMNTILIKYKEIKEKVEEHVRDIFYAADVRK